MSIIPKGVQKEVLALEPGGHIVVLGAAGSGKTTLALLLAKKWANLAASPNVLVVTFNRPLIEYMKGIGSTSQTITLETFHKFALGYLHSQGEETNNCVIPNCKKNQIISTLLEEAHRKDPGESTYTRPLKTFIDEIQFLDSFGVRSEQEYIDMERVGRSDTYISREKRPYFYAIYQQYKEKRDELGYHYDWDDIATKVYDTLCSDTTPRRYSHVIVDEGQDFSPMMLKALTRAVAPGGSFTFFGDVAQRIYGNSISWKASGINTQKIWRFEHNYRNPQEIALFAQDITLHPKWEAKGTDYVLPQIEVPAAGIRPTLIHCSDQQAEQNQIIHLLAGQGGRNVVIVKSRALVGQFISALHNIGVTATEIKQDLCDSLQDGIYVTTYYSAKGLEFDNVYMPFLNDEDFPDSVLLSSCESSDKEYENALRLFYVAATRAKQNLIMTYSSTLTSLFPVDSKNYSLVDIAGGVK